ncbi:MAG TPA: glycosyltransferase family 39 protein [Thermoanaerobaculia bacterium]
MSHPERAWLAAIIAAAALLRLWLNDVSSFSPADEAVYVDLSRRLAEGGFFSGYGPMAREWLRDPSWWVYPNPLRCGHLALTTIAVRLYGSADPRALAWLSTLAGIAVVPVLFAAARRIAGTRTALLAAAFAAVSPLGLAMGRRALQDEVLCAAVLLAFAAVVAMLDDEKKSVVRMLLAVAALTFALAVKETLLLLFPALAVFVVLYPRPSGITARLVALFVAPPLLWWAVLSALTGDATMLFRTARLVASSMAARYVVQYQSGPPHRLLFDFFAVAPFVFVLACAAAVALMLDRRRERRIRAVAAFLVLGLAAFSLLSSKNLRFIVMLDPLVRLLAAWVVVRPDLGAEARTSTLIAAGAANAAIELELFRAIFITGGVYDPVTHTLLAAMGAVPHAAASPPAAMLWPWICAAIAGALWLARRPGSASPVAVTGYTAPS